MKTKLIIPENPKITKYRDGSYDKEWIDMWGNPYRKEGPTLESYDKNDFLIYEQYCINDKYSRTDGPARIFYGLNINDIKYEYWYNHIKFDSLKELQAYIKTLILI